MAPCLVSESCRRWEMFAGLVYGELASYPDTIQRTTPLLERLKNQVSRLRRVKSYSLLNNWETGTVTLLCLWESDEDRQRDWERTSATITSARDVMWRSSPTLRLFDVYGSGPGATRSTRPAPSERTPQPKRGSRTRRTGRSTRRSSTRTRGS